MHRTSQPVSPELGQSKRRLLNSLLQIATIHEVKRLGNEINFALQNAVSHLKSEMIWILFRPVVALTRALGTPEP